MKHFLATALLGLITLASAISHGALRVRDFDPNKLADDGTWDKFVCKGGQLVQAMQASDADAGKLLGKPSAQSEFKGDMKQDFATWAYTEGFVSSITCDFKGYWNVETACKALGLDTRPKMWGGPNICYNFQHWDANKKDDKGSTIPKSQQKYKVNGKEYRVTGADLQIAVNPVGGVIFEQYVTSPETSAKNVWNQEPSLDELPKLRALSDIMWGAWNRDNANTKNIRYFWVQGVGNGNTKALIARALKGVGAKLEKWPGTTFDMKGDAGRAILASDNAACFAFFLFQHKAELGNVVISKVQVFRNDASSNVDPDLIFHVAAASEAQVSDADAGAQFSVNGAAKHVLRTHTLAKGAP
ncbi:hypothetical protein K458DRAFT_353540 [Lentithecium fluviatile CBS 122367]|uniref:Uncharacterized protein n=1 Tax=Lentithecium fluviatile CBS 122367 TaxID=1168545 RepID=A0A6G1JNA8_9PLEO|nr:hypothetical protein K458DRAFT_353540 [Lentithecium fluviatile CBS 122367]